MYMCLSFRMFDPPPATRSFVVRTGMWRHLSCNLSYPCGYFHVLHDECLRPQVSCDVGQLGKMMLEFVNMFRVFGKSNCWLLLIEREYRWASEDHLEGTLSVSRSRSQWISSAWRCCTFLLGRWSHRSAWTVRLASISVFRSLLLA